MGNKNLRKRDRVLNVVKAGAKRTRNGFQKIQPVLKKIKPIINPRSALLGFLIMSVIPSPALAAPNPLPDVEGLPGWQGNVTLALLLAGMVEEASYHSACMVPGIQWFNSRIGAPLAAIGAYACAGGSAVCHSVGWHTKGWKFTTGSAACTSYIIGAHRATPNDPVVTAVRVVTSPFEVAKDTTQTMESA